MTTELLDKPAEITPAQPDLSFINVDSVESLRQDEQKALTMAGAAAIRNLSFEQAIFEGYELREAAYNQTKAHFPERCEEFVTSNFNIETYPELANQLMALIKSVSLEKMDYEKWYQGDRDARGDHVPGTSGQDMLREAIRQLSQKPQPTVDTLSDEEYATYISNLEDLRTKLAINSIERRLKIRKGSKAAKQLAEESESLQPKYNDTFIKVSREDTRRMKEQGLIDDEDTQAQENVKQEHQSFNAAEYDYLNSDNSLKGRFARFYARKRNMIVSNTAGGLAFGGLVGLGVRGLGGTILAVAPPAAAGLSLAARTTKSILFSTVGNRANQHIMFEKRSAQDQDKLGKYLGEVAADASDIYVGSGEALQKVISERIKKDQTYNRNRVIESGLVAGITGALGHYAVEHLVHGGTGLIRPKPTPSGPKPHPVPYHGGIPKGKSHHLTPHHHVPTPKPRHVTPTTPTQTKPLPNPNVYDGFDTKIKVPYGYGYTQELQALAVEKGINLNGAQSWDAYLALASQNGGHFFSNIDSYVRPEGDYGISRPGEAVWTHQTIQDFLVWLDSNKKSVAA